jgi:hypothetical protein
MRPDISVIIPVKPFDILQTYSRANTHGGVRIAGSREELTISHAAQQASGLLPTAAPLVRFRG